MFRADADAAGIESMCTAKQQPTGLRIVGSRLTSVSFPFSSLSKSVRQLINMRAIRSRVRMQREWYRWSTLEEYVSYVWSLLRRIFFEKPAVWALNLYDRHWSSRFRRIPDVHEMARRGIIGGESLLDAPVALPKTRKRALTHPLPPMESRSMPFNLRRSRQRTHEQAQSPFLTKLPIEIREMIYEEILGGGDRRLVHVLRKDRRLGHWRCRLQDGEEVCDEQDRRCVEGWLSYKSKVWHLDRNGMLDLVTDGGLLPLLLTCRAMYVSTQISSQNCVNEDPQLL